MNAPDMIKPRMPPMMATAIGLDTLFSLSSAEYSGMMSTTQYTNSAELRDTKITPMAENTMVAPLRRTISAPLLKMNSNDLLAAVQKSFELIATSTYAFWLMYSRNRVKQSMQHLQHNTQHDSTGFSFAFACLAK
eukprot:CAMPEP_0178457902 /NCGR_PEP_ID=MMETSP0689_2-20121128/47264_1 /TAXON_ID=160604 /ORGANISM="Amphidinium massartii, Strain CS-259" /LENGTH=134 /DNA_ID=CAMNT_0020084183 /DNA_START=200 /DNA_END=604 /DNA_ORIENTATION=-